MSFINNVGRDLHDTLSISSDNEEDYSGDDFDCSYSYASDDDCNKSDDGLESDNDDVNCVEKKSYLILKEDELDKFREKEVEKVTSVLSLSNEDAAMLLLNYNWSATNVNEAWFEDEVKVRETVGLLDVHHDVKFPKNDETEVECRICFDSVMVKDTANCGCGHVFCKVCWENYICIAIQDGPGCLTIKCPEPSCGVAVGPDMVKVLVKGEEKKRYDRFWVRSYVESNKKIKWCPSPGCDYAIKFDTDSYNADNYDVTCECKYDFCWKCLEDPHSPSDCETVGKWIEKNKDEAGNTTWILAYTKACPKCGKLIEKDAGCMHMTCAQPCGHEFCWLCLAPYIAGISGSSHFDIPCNAFHSEEDEDEETSKNKRERNSALKAIMRYSHYYERWDANERSRRKAFSDIQKIETVDLQKLSSNYDMPVTQLQFITDAWLQIVECRRMLEWTYVYGYYLPEKEEEKKVFFEFLQGDAETALERLHVCAEMELQIYIKREDAEAVTKDKFDKIFREKLTRLTNVTRSYFKKLGRAIENGLSQVDNYDLVQY